MSERELIERAIESARCRIYRVQASAMGGSVQHQAKADDQAKLQVVTIKALEKQIPKKPTIEDDFDYGEGYVCPICESFLHYVVDDDEHYRTNYCLHCGQKLDWGNEDAE